MKYKAQSTVWDIEEFFHWLEQNYPDVALNAVPKSLCDEYQDQVHENFLDSQKGTSSMIQLNVPTTDIEGTFIRMSEYEKLKEVLRQTSDDCNRYRRAWDQVSGWSVELENKLNSKVKALENELTITKRDYEDQLKCADNWHQKVVEMTGMIRELKAERDEVKQWIEKALGILIRIENGTECIDDVTALINDQQSKEQGDE